MPIQEIEGAAVQVRVTGSDQQTRTKYFAYALHGGRECALELARKAEQALRQEFGEPLNPGFNYNASKSKASGERNGVTLYATADRRKLGAPLYARFAVHWTDENGQKRNKGFQVGRVDDITNADIEFARTVANGFREMWEACVLLGQRFDPKAFDGWRLPDWQMPDVPDVKAILEARKREQLARLRLEAMPPAPLEQAPPARRPRP